MIFFYPVRLFATGGMIQFKYQESIMGRIGKGNHVLLVYDYNLYPKFLNYLHKKGYHTASPHGYYESCPWIYVNIELKTYFPGQVQILV